MDEIGPAFFRRDPVVCARDLIGCVFRWKGCEGRIVETEAYAESGDPACHTFFRPSARDFIARHDAGTAYVYLNYGVHWLFNVVTKGADGAGFVLIRALEPISGIPTMEERRGTSALRSLCSGPGKLTRALGLTGLEHGTSFLGLKESGIRKGESVSGILTGPRIGISRGLERNWRFGEAGSRFLSKEFRV